MTPDRSRLRHHTPRQMKRVTMALAASWFLVGCVDRGCTELGCWGVGASLYFDRTEDDWAGEQGSEYVMLVTSEDVVVGCTVTIGGSSSCDPGVEIVGFSSGPLEINGLYELVFDGYLGPTRITIERDGSVVFEDDYDIVETIDYPNGSCGPACQYWRGQASW